MATLRQTFSDIASAIRAKGVSGTMKPIEMASKIGQIQTGGGGQDYGYLTFTAEEIAILSLKQNGNIAPLKLLKSTDRVTWTKWENPSTNGIVLNAGQSVYLKADEDASNTTATGDNNFNSYSSTGRIKCNGSLMPEISLNPGTNNYSYFVSKLFRNCTTLTKAPKLPATTLAKGCYQWMFGACSSLTQAPQLPATTLADTCYSNMFFNCKSLKRIKMNASSGSWGTYMFSGCTSLELVDMTGSTRVPQL